MKILFANAHHYLPQYVGGLQSSTHELALELIKRGSSVAVLADLIGDDLLGIRSRLSMKLLGRKASVDHSVGYPVYRTWFAWEAADYVMQKVVPDVVIVQPRYAVRVARAFERSGVPLVVYLRDVEFQDYGGSIRELIRVQFIANSRFTADRHLEAFGITSKVIHPLFQAERYKTQTMRRNVTFINPVRPKGLDLAIEIAFHCPDIPFCFVEGWKLGARERAELISRVEHLPNVRVRPSTNDMREIYSEARLVLAPSKWDEAWGRIASEAHFSGIPVVASSCGGLPESVGPGGVLLDRAAPVESWVEAVRRLWFDTSYYEEVSQAAFAYADRPALRPAHQVDTLLSVLREAISSK